MTSPNRPDLLCSLMIHSTAGIAFPLASARRWATIGLIAPGLEAQMLVKTYAIPRTENRVEMKVTALLIGTHGLLGVERAITENVSSRGVRVISPIEWDVDDTILVSLPAGHYTSAARVAYCDASGKGRYITGLEFVGSDGGLQVSTMDTSTSY